jgi:arylsulfatase
MSTDLQGEHYPGFGGKVGRVLATSEPWWPPRPTAPEGTPNIVIVLADDLGYSDLSSYGSEIPTPAIDALAGVGCRYTNFHVTPLCSPTRAALLTGLNTHQAGMGYVANADPGFPGYASELPRHQPSLAEVLQANGYATMAVGKWHLCRDTDLSEAGDKHSWPLQRGFDQYYGFLEALTNFHHPHRLYEGNSVVQTNQYPDGYYLTDDLTERAVRMIREVRQNDPVKPFFLYYSHGAVHAPLHAKADDIARHRGNYDKGWDRLREERLARQIELGIVPEGTVLPPRNSEPGEDVKEWDSLPEIERKVMARYMEVYAAMVESIDQSVAAIRDTLEDLGELDNTIFIFTSDNGASREGQERGSTSYFTTSGGVSATITEETLANIDAIGGPTTWPHYPRGWAMACNTPFRLYKMMTYRGGHSVPFVCSWPDGPIGQAEMFRGQYTHVTDILPTMVDLLGLELPSERHGRPAEPLAGMSFAPSLVDPDAPTVHTEQYYECVGHRAFYRDGWAAVTYRIHRTPYSEDCWELFNVAEDLNELNDLSTRHPEKLAELKEAWEEAAWRNRVFPLNEGTELMRAVLPPEDERLTRPVRIVPGTPTLERVRSRRLIGGRSFRIDVRLDHRPGDEGVLVAHGGQEAGYVLYLEDGQLHLEMNEDGHPKPFPPAPIGDCSAITVDVTAPGERRWDVKVIVDGKTVSEGVWTELTREFLPFEGIDVGIDRRSPVSWSLYERRGCFPYTGNLIDVVYTPGEYAPDAPEVRIEDMRAIGLALE